jgi:hypothetical protein
MVLGNEQVLARSRQHNTIPLHTDRIELVGESEKSLAAGERGR